MEKQDGLELACRFSSITNRLRYCGPKDAYKDFYSLLKGEKYDPVRVRDHFSRYEGLYVYLNHMSRKLGMDPLDRRIIEAYWIGNELLDKFGKDDLKEIVMLLVKRGLPLSHARALIDRMPDGMNLHHSFNVLFVGVGKTTGSVPTNILTMNKCTVLCGRVVKLRKETMLVQMPLLRVVDGIMMFGEPVAQEIEYVPEFLHEIRVGDCVGVHWDFACKVIDMREEKLIYNYTQKNMDALNRAGYFKAGFYKDLPKPMI